MGRWKPPPASVGFSVLSLILLAASGGSQRIVFLRVKEIQCYVPPFAAYGVMSARFNTLAISLVNRRETGRLKRTRLSPLPAWAMLAAVFLSSPVVSIVQVVLLLAVGRFGFHVQLPPDLAPFVVAMVVCAFCSAVRSPPARSYRTRMPPGRC